MTATMTATVAEPLTLTLRDGVLFSDGVSEAGPNEDGPKGTADGGVRLGNRVVEQEGSPGGVHHGVVAA